MSCQTDCYQHVPGLRIRPLHELEVCMVFTPRHPKLYRLNTHAWLVLELCSGQTRGALEEEYIVSVVPPLTKPVAQRQLEECLAALERNGIIQKTCVAALE